MSVRKKDYQYTNGRTMVAGRFGWFGDDGVCGKGSVRSTMSWILGHVALVAGITIIYRRGDPTDRCSNRDSGRAIQFGENAWVVPSA